MHIEQGLRIDPLKIGLGFLAVTGLYLTSLVSYLLFHSLVEVFSIVVAGGIFMVAWNTRRITPNGYLLFMGIASLFVAGIDLIHTLAYKGMGVFAGVDSNLPTQLWIAARYLQALSFLIAPYFLYHRIRENTTVAAFAVVTALLLGTIFFWKIFPACYIEGIGLTPFKKVSELIISGILVAALVVLNRSRDRFDPDVKRFLEISLGLSILGELSFTSYASVYSFLNLAGHLFKVISFYCLYRAVVVTGLARPYHLLFRDLKQSEATLRRLTEELDLRVNERTAELERANQDLLEYHSRLESLVDERTQALQHEIAERRRAEEVVTAYAKRLEQKNRELEDFAFIASHDLQEPLRKIIAFGSRLRERYAAQLGDEGADFLQRMESAADRMQSMINNLLEYSRVSTHTQPFCKVDLAKVVEDVVSDLEVALERTDGVVETQTLPEIEADPIQMRQLLQNLIGNALKFHRPDLPPRVKITGAVRNHSEPQLAEIRVEDNGIGFDEKYLERIFQPFQRLHGRGEYEGNGIGLAICRKIAERHHGELVAHSQPGAGSTFTFTVPVRQADGSASEDWT